MNLKIPAILIALLVMGSFVNAKVDIDKMSVTLSTDVNDTGDDSLSIDPGEKFYVFLQVRPESDLDNADGVLKIYVDDDLVYSETVTMDLVEDEYYLLHVSSDDFDEGDIWEGNLVAYDCDDHEIKVTIGSKDISSTKTDTVSLEIDADDLKVSINPEKPTLTDKITVTVKDSDKDELEGMTVKFTRLGDSDTWNTDDKNWDDDTDGDGEVTLKLSEEFGSSSLGKYQMDVFDDSGDYCKYTTIIDTRVSLVLSSPDPASPMVGQSMKMRVTNQDGAAIAGAKVTVSRTGGVSTFTTDSQGYITFQMNASGSYDAIATKSGYTDSLVIKVTVSEKNSLRVDISPDKDVQVGSDVTVTVSGSDGKALKNAKVSFIQSDATTEEYTSSESGQVVYKPRNAGQYKVKVEAASYAAVTKEFKAYKAFTVALSDRLFPKEDITVEVTDADARPVNGASVSIKESGATGTTDVSGKYTFSVDEPREYTLSVKKDGYVDYVKKLVIQGVLSVKISDKEIPLGDSLEIVAQDSQGNKVDGKITITKPNGEDETLATDEYKPSLAGTYTVSVSKDGYQTATGEFNVKAYPLVLKAKMEGTKIVATATSDGNPVPEIAISFEGAGFREEILTDKNGKAILDTGKSNVSGNVTISSKEANYEKASTEIEVKVVPGTDSSMLLVILVALIIVIIAIIAVTTKGGKKRKEKGMLYRTAGGKSHLEGQ
ncbi:MAG: carboxypeptidase regulatory-like domain-containing protein [Candidatus Altiarchaeia archaeon]